MRSGISLVSKSIRCAGYDFIIVMFVGLKMTNTWVLHFALGQRRLPATRFEICRSCTFWNASNVPRLPHLGHRSSIGGYEPLLYCVASSSSIGADWARFGKARAQLI